MTFQNKTKVNRKQHDIINALLMEQHIKQKYLKENKTSCNIIISPNLPRKKIINNSANHETSDNPSKYRYNIFPLTS